MTTILDADALIGLMIATDVHYSRTHQLQDTLKKQNAIFLLLPSTLGEFVSIATNRIGVPLTQKAAATIERAYTMIDLPTPLAKDALHVYMRQTSKENSLFDCYVMAAANEQAVDCIFSFDRGYTKNGFVLTEAFLATQQF